MNNEQQITAALRGISSLAKDAPDLHFTFILPSGLRYDYDPKTGWMVAAP